MLPPTGNGALHAVIATCRACRDACDPRLAQAAGGERDRAFDDTLRCIALLSVVADTLERDGACAPEVCYAAVELANELPDDGHGCAAACRTAAAAMSRWLDGGFEREP